MNVHWDIHLGGQTAAPALTPGKKIIEPYASLSIIESCAEIVISRVQPQTIGHRPEATSRGSHDMGMIDLKHH